MFNTNGYTLADIAAVSGNRGNGWADGDSWWIILLFMFAFGGWGRGGMFGDGNGTSVHPYATPYDVRAAVDQQTLISKLDQQTYGLADSTYTLSAAMTNGFHGVDNAVCTLGYNTQAGFNTLANQMANCCCETQRLVERGFADTNYNLATQSCETRRAICDSTREIIDFLTQDKIATLSAENQALKFAASQANQNAFIIANQEAQTAELIRRLATPVAVPAYMVPNPNAYYSPCSCNG